MNEAGFIYMPTGVIHGKHVAAGDTPVQPACAGRCPGRMEVFPEFAGGAGNGRKGGQGA